MQASPELMRFSMCPFFCPQEESTVVKKQNVNLTSLDNRKVKLQMPETGKQSLRV